MYCRMHNVQNTTVLYEYNIVLYFILWFSVLTKSKITIRTTYNILYTIISEEYYYYIVCCEDGPPGAAERRQKFGFRLRWGWKGEDSFTMVSWILANVLAQTSFCKQRRNQRTKWTKYTTNDRRLYVDFNNILIKKRSILSITSLHTFESEPKSPITTKNLKKN